MRIDFIANNEGLAFFLKPALSGCNSTMRKVEQERRYLFMTFLDKLKEKRTTYAEMIDFCCDNCILNNDIINKLSQNDFYFDVFCGDYYEYYDENGCEITNDEYNKLVDGNISCYEREREIYQYYLINYNDACRLSNYTNELVLYNEELELYVLCVCHWGTSWDYVSSNWKDKEDENEG